MDRLLTVHRVLSWVSCCSFIARFGARWLAFELRANGVNDRSVLFDRFKTSHRKMEQ